MQKIKRFYAQIFVFGIYANYVFAAGGKDDFFKQMQTDAVDMKTQTSTLVGYVLGIVGIGLTGTSVYNIFSEKGNKTAGYAAGAGAAVTLGSGTYLSFF